MGKVSRSKESAEAQLASLNIYDHNLKTLKKPIWSFKQATTTFPGVAFDSSTIGKLAPLQRAQISNSRTFSFLMGIIAFIAFYNFSMFIKRPEDKSALILGFFF